LKGGTGISGLMRGLATVPPSWIQEPSVVRDRDGRTQEDSLAVYCFCVCSGSALLGDLLGVSRSRERDLLSVLSIYPRFCVLSRFILLYVDECWLLWFSCQYLPPPFRLAASVLWCWSWEKEGRTVEVVPGISPVRAPGL